MWLCLIMVVMVPVAVGDNDKDDGVEHDDIFDNDVADDRRR